MRKQFDFLGADQGHLSQEEIQHIRATVVESIHHRLIARKIYPMSPDTPDPGAFFYRYYTETDPSQALIDLQGVAQADDIPIKDHHDVPLPVIYKTFLLQWRDILASRRLGPSLLDDSIRTAAWQVADVEDRLLLSGECTTWTALGIEGLATRTGRTSLAATGNWPGNAVADINVARAHLQAHGFVGIPPVMIGPPAMVKCLDQFMTNTSVTYRTALLANGLVSAIHESANVFSTTCTQDIMLLVVPEKDNFYMVESMAPTTLLWRDKMDNVYGTVKEIVAPIIPRPDAIYEITGITCT